MLKSVLVRDHMSTDLVTLDPDMDLLRAAHKLIRKGVSGAPVVDKTGGLLGVLTERDFISAVMHGEYHAIPIGLVKEFMSKDPKTVSPEDSILKVAQLFINGRFHRYPVVENNRLVGLISRRDVMRAMGEHYPL